MQTATHRPDAASLLVSWRGALLRWFDPGEPHPTRGPFARWPRTTDAALAVTVFALSLVAVTLSARGDNEDLTLRSLFDRPVGGFVMLAVAAVALLWRRQRPIIVASSIMGVMAVWGIADYGDGQELALVVALYSVGRYSTDYLAGLATLAAAIGLSLLATVVDSHQRVDIAPAVVLGWLPWYIGYRIRNRGDYLTLLRERADRLEVDQQASARQAVAEERSRIARELHDVVAHQVSMMTVQAGAAKTIAHHDLESAVEAMADVEHAGRQALGDLRHLLGVLRLDEPASDALGPQPKIGDLAVLADQLAHTGADVSVSIAPLPAALSAAVELSAYRIVQESFTNVIKHAGPKPAVRLTVDLDEFGLLIVVTNTMNATGTVVPGLPISGYGIAGIRERATLLGGTLTAEPEPPNRFRVEAHLPIRSERT